MISIITLTNNNTNDLSTLASAISDVDHGQLEWYIKDASTTDNDLDNLRQLKKSWESKVRLTINSDSDKSLYNAFNIACMNAQGSHFINFNPDDHLNSNSFREVLTAGRYTEYDIVVYPLQLSKNNDVRQRKTYTGKLSKSGYRSYLDGCATSLLFSRQTYNSFNGFDEKYAVSSDLDFMIKICKNYEKLTFYYADLPIGMYGMNGISAQLDIKQFKEIFLIYYRNLGFLSACFLSSKAIIGRLKTKVFTNA